MTGPRLAATSLALALAAAGLAVWRGREEGPKEWADARTTATGPRGAAALHDWLAATGRRPLRAAHSAAREAPAGAVLVLAAPPLPLEPAEADALLDRVRQGALLIWAVGPPGQQPALERRLRASRARGRPGVGEAAALVPHPLVDGLTLSTSGASVSSGEPAALAVAGGEGFDSVIRLPLGAGEVLLLAGPDLLENLRLERADNLAFWARLAARGRVTFDEGHWGRPAGAASPSRRGLGLLAAQALLVALVLAWARGRRLGAIRPPPSPQASRTAADYVAALAALYRRSGAARELGEAGWRAHRRRLQARAGLPAGLAEDEAIRRLELRSPAAARAFRRAAALRAGGTADLDALRELVAATAEAETALTGRRPVDRAPRSL